ncbi:MAG: hypothetical protein ACRDYV_16835, partial [Acidimicrobiia bacterium]
MSDHTPQVRQVGGLPDPDVDWLLRCARGEVDTDKALREVRLMHARLQRGESLPPVLAKALVEGDERHPHPWERWATRDEIRPGTPEVDADPETTAAFDRLAATRSGGTPDRPGDGHPNGSEAHSADGSESNAAALATTTEGAGGSNTAAPLQGADKGEKGGQSRVSPPSTPLSTGADPPWPTLDRRALRGVLGDVVETVEPVTEADPVALLTELMCAVGNAIGSGPHALADAAQHPARLFAVLVGRSARARKGTARSHRNRLMAYADAGWATNAPFSGFGSGEAIVKELATDRDQRMLVEESEFAKVLAVCERDGSILSGTIRDAWDGVPLRR